MDMKDKGWPKEGRSLTRKLSGLKTNLRDMGLEVQLGIHRQTGNILRIHNLLYEAPIADGPINQEVSSASEGSNEANPQADEDSEGKSDADGIHPVDGEIKG